MALDLLFDADEKFFSDNLLTSDDLNFVVEVDPTDFLDPVGDELLKQLSEDLEIPMLLDNDDPITNLGLENSDPYPNVKELPNGGPELLLKPEPVSPIPSPPSPLDSDSSSSETWPSLCFQMEPKLELKGLETPPITPPQSSMDSSPPATPVMDFTDTSLPSEFSFFTTQSTTVPTCVAGTVNAQMIVTNTAVNSSPLSCGVKVQPKSTLPPPIKPKQTVSTCKTVPGQPLILTPDEFAKLTAQGILRFKPPAPPISQPPSSVPKPVRTPVIPNMNPSKSVFSQRKHDIDLKALKRQQRMIKNRESACLSRKKKKEYVTNLEAQVKEISRENMLLQSENEKLIQRIRELENENQMLKKSSSVFSAKKTTALLAVLFMISLNLGSLSGIFLNNKAHIKTIQDTISVHKGRSLLWVNDEFSKFQTNQSIEESQINFEFKDIQMNSNTSTTKLICPMFINKTESLRLDSELRGWVFNTKKRNKTNSREKGLQKLLPPIPRLRNYIINEFSEETHKSRDEYNSKEIEIYNLPGKSYDDFLEAIQRRDDTFYVVSFTGDHLLLPALAHNKTRRPLMSLVLPTISLNETMKPPKDHIAMMQIDCEVTNTRLVQVKKSLVQPHLQKQANHTSFSPSNTHRKSKPHRENKNNSSKQKT